MKLKGKFWIAGLQHLNNGWFSRVVKWLCRLCVLIAIGSRLGLQPLMEISIIQPLPWYMVWKMAYHRLRLPERHSWYKLSDIREAWRAKGPHGSITSNPQVCCLSNKQQRLLLLILIGWRRIILDVRRMWLCLPTLANVWNLWLYRAWFSCFTPRYREQTTENLSYGLLLIVFDLLCYRFLFMSSTMLCIGSSFQVRTLT